MKNHVLVATLTAISLTFGGLAFAKDRDDRDDRHGRDERRGQSQHADPGRDHRGPRGNQGAQNHRPHQQEFAEGRGAGPDHNFRKGGRLPPEYRGRYYVVEDWRGHRLSAPPRGYHWVQIGGDYVLVANPTGIIVQIYLGQ